MALRHHNIWGEPYGPDGRHAGVSEGGDRAEKPRGSHLRLVRGQGKQALLETVVRPEPSWALPPYDLDVLRYLASVAERDAERETTPPPDERPFD